MSVFTPKTVTLPDGAAVTLRSPGLDEAQPLIEYLDAVRRETNGIMFAAEDDLLSVEAERQWIESHLNDARAVLIGAYAGDEIIALSGVHPSRFYRQQHTAGVGISIRCAWCDRGLGTLLMRELVDWARVHPTLRQLTLCVFDSNPRAQAVYRKVGFGVDGVLPRRAQVDGDYVGLVEMSLWLGEMAVAS